MDKMAAFGDWPVPTNKEELTRFLNTLPFLRTFIPGRADYATLLRTTVVEESVTVKRDGKQQTTKNVVEFRWTKQHQQAFDAIKIC